MPQLRRQRTPPRTAVPRANPPWCHTFCSCVEGLTTAGGGGEGIGVAAGVCEGQVFGGADGDVEWRGGASAAPSPRGFQGTPTAQQCVTMVPTCIVGVGGGGRAARDGAALRNRRHAFHIRRRVTHFLSFPMAF